ncbi:aldo/keto reductase [Tomitella gaofuii]|uniref:aldo/keto reductase n=1 Tax=Tomitella gaofuii TaxID=2760083 RepID=UPI0015F8F8BD|nr:aldo/keto reductase [Tomitella gaofuii]
MKETNLGRSGLRVSGLGLGTLAWGRETAGDEAAGQLRAFAEAGGTLVDTSPAYGDGAAEAVLAELLEDVVPRRDLVLSSAAGIVPSAPVGERVDCSRRTLLHQLDATLLALGTDHLDLWQVAAWDRRTPVGEIVDTCDYAVRTGRVRYTGVRGHFGWQLATVAGRARASHMVAAQAEYSLLARGVEEELVPAALHHGMGLLAAVPLAGGVLTGKYRDGVPSDSRGADASRAEIVQAYLHEDAVSVIDAVVTAADGLGTSPLAVALAWIRDRPGVGSAIVGARDIAQLTGVLVAADLTLPPAITAALDDVSG